MRVGLALGIMSYQKLLLEYAQTLASIDKSVEGGRRRLRWEKDEAMGNSKFRWTGTKVRYAHVVNRSLQMNLDKNVSVWAKTHGSTCNEIEAKQRDVWTAQKKRNSLAGSTYLDRQGMAAPKITVPLFYKRENTPRMSCNATPYSTASDYAIYRRPLEPTVQRKVNRQNIAARRFRAQSRDSQNLSASEISCLGFKQFGDGRVSLKSVNDNNKYLLLA